VEGADAEDEEAGDHPGAALHVGEVEPGLVVEDDGAEVGEPGLAVDDLVADRVVHPGVGQHDPEGADLGADGDQPDGPQTHPGLEPVLAEPPQPDERALEEEGHQHLERERDAEDVADEVGVLAPVHPELELLHDAGHHADGEVDEEEVTEEVGHLPVELAAVAADEGEGLHHRDEEGQPDGERDEEEVEDARRGELEPGELHHVHAHLPQDRTPVTE